MSDASRIDALVRLAFDEARSIEPTDAEIRSVVRRAQAQPVRKVRARRILATAAAMLTVVVASALAVPQSREALFNGFGAFRDFLTGGEPPGTPLPADDNDALLNSLRGTDTTNGAVIAQAQSLRLVAYREPTTRMACFAYGASVAACRPDKEWNDLLVASPVFLTGPLPEADSAGRLPLFGLIADNITTIRIEYADGGSERVDDVRYGFIVFADPVRTPTTLTAQDATGATVATTDIRDRQWEFHP